MNIKISKEFIIYCLVGIINTIAGLTTAFLSLNLFLFNYTVSTALAYVVGIVVSFFLNKKFTFHNKGNAGKQFFKFVFTMLPAYVFSYWLGFQVGHILMKISFINSVAEFVEAYKNIPLERFADNFSVLISMAIYLFVGFAINKFLVFKK